MKEKFILPEKWCIRWATEEIYEACCKYFNKPWLYVLIYRNSWSISDKTHYRSYTDELPTNCGYTEITFDQFKQYVLKQLPECYCFKYDKDNPVAVKALARLNEITDSSVVGLWSYYGQYKDGSILRTDVSYYKDDLVEITPEEFLEMTADKEVSKEESIPEKWCVQAQDEDEVEEMKNIMYSLIYRVPGSNVGTFFHFPEIEYCTCTSTEQEAGYTLITLKQLKSHLKTQNMDTQSINGTAIKNTQTITRSGLKEIHDVACIEWKDKLAGKAEQASLFSNTIEFTDKEVEEMFKAATNSQLPIISKYFKRPVEEDKNAFKRGSNQYSSSVRELSKNLFGDRNIFQIMTGSTPFDRLELNSRSFHVLREYKVETGEANGGGTWISIYKK